MKLRKIAELLDAQVLSREELQDRDVVHVFCTDVMADVLAFSIPDTVLITRLHNLSVVRSALMADIPCIVFSDSLVPAPELVNLADIHGLAVMSCAGTMFDAVAALLDAGLQEAEWI